MANEHPLVKLLKWCRENTYDGRLSMCRVEKISECHEVCGPCRSIEKRAQRLEKALTSGDGSHRP